MLGTRHWSGRVVTPSMYPTVVYFNEPSTYIRSAKCGVSFVWVYSLAGMEPQFVPVCIKLYANRTRKCFDEHVFENSAHPKSKRLHVYTRL